MGSKFDGMLSDIKDSIDLKSRWLTYHLERQPPLPFNFNVQVLTRVWWPIGPFPRLNRPQLMQGAEDAFCAFYAEIKGHRRLQFHPGYGHVTVHYSNETGNKHELQMPTSAAAVVLLFNDKDMLSVEDIKKLMISPSETLQAEAESELHTALKLLFSTAKSRDQLFKINGSSKNIESGSSILYNPGFKSQSRVVLFRQARREDSKQEAASTRQQVLDDRKWVIDAVIVRVMKAHKTMQHNLLLCEITKQCQKQFTPDPNQIKKRLESLIDREFLERSSESGREYVYKA
eukprot:gene9044-1622_t